MANLRGIINRVVGGGAGAAGGRRVGGTPGPGRVGGPGVGAGGGRRGTDEAIGRGVRGLLGRFGGRR